MSEQNTEPTEWVISTNSDHLRYPPAPPSELVINGRHYRQVSDNPLEEARLALCAISMADLHKDGGKFSINNIEHDGDGTVYAKISFVVQEKE